MNSRLEAFEEMLSEVMQRYSELTDKLDKLKAEGKTKTASFRELLGEKLTCRYMISLYEKHGLIQKNLKER